MKRCTKCLHNKSIGDYNIRWCSVDGLQPKCRSCQKTDDLARYLAAPKLRTQKVRARTVANLLWLNEQKASRGCAECGVKDPRVLDFDHQPGAKKSACVSRMVSLSQKRLAEEVAKCVVLCSNCHRVQTHLRRHGTLDVQMSKRVKRWECLRRNFADLMEIKSRPCMDCNKTFHPTAMDLDHLDPTQKLGEPSELAKGARTS